MELKHTQTYPGSFPEQNPVDIYRCVLTQALVNVTGLSPDEIYPALSWQNNLAHGDLLLAVPRLRVKGKAPADLAREWASKMPSHPLLLPPEVDNIYLRWRFSPERLPNTVLPMVFKLGSKYGLNPAHGLKDPSKPAKGAKRIVVEFRQYGLLAIGWARYGNEELFQANPIGHLFDIYVRISKDFNPEEEAYKAAGKRGEDTSALEKQGHLGEAKSYFKRMEDGDEEALAL
ncbi:hypothetical protein MMC25_000348 [Agyrium rufum]|nr:hypothetical protein [Agyrium rufum]